MGRRHANFGDLGGNVFFRMLRVLVPANFAAFVVAAYYLGGDAINGYAANGHFYLRLHGKLTEVSHAVYQYSWWHAVSVIASIGSIVAYGVLLRPLARWLRASSRF